MTNGRKNSTLAEAPPKKRGRPAKAKVGHNSDDKGVFLDFVREATLTLRAVEEAQGRHRAVLRRAKAAGLDTKIMLDTMRLKRRDPDELNSNQIRRVTYAAWSGSPFGTQAKMFEALDASDDLTEAELHARKMWDADEAGYRAGRSGQDRTSSNPHPLGSEYHVAFDLAWVKGQAAIAEEMGPDKQRKIGKRSSKNPEDHDGEQS